MQVFILRLSLKRKALLKTTTLRKTLYPRRNLPLRIVKLEFENKPFGEFIFTNPACQQFTKTWNLNFAGSTFPRYLPFLLTLLLCVIYAREYNLKRLDRIIPQTESQKVNQDARIPEKNSWIGKIVTKKDEFYGLLM